MDRLVHLIEAFVHLPLHRHEALLKIGNQLLVHVFRSPRSIAERYHRSARGEPRFAGRLYASPPWSGTCLFPSPGAIRRPQGDVL